jgi:hypothetical protein
MAAVCPVGTPSRKFTQARQLDLVGVPLAEQPGPQFAHWQRQRDRV